MGKTFEIFELQELAQSLACKSNARMYILYLISIVLPTSAGIQEKQMEKAQLERIGRMRKQ